MEAKKKEVRVEWLTRKRHVSKKPEVVRGRCTCSPSRHRFLHWFLPTKSFLKEIMSMNIFLAIFSYFPSGWTCGLLRRDWKDQTRPVFRSKNGLNIFLFWPERIRLEFVSSRVGEEWDFIWGYFAIVEVDLIYSFTWCHSIIRKILNRRKKKW